MVYKDFILFYNSEKTFYNSIINNLESLLKLKFHRTVKHYNEQTESSRHIFAVHSVFRQY